MFVGCRDVVVADVKRGRRRQSVWEVVIVILASWIWWFWEDDIVDCIVKSGMKHFGRLTGKVECCNVPRI